VLTQYPPFLLRSLQRKSPEREVLLSGQAHHL
jgi:hypothetical protein